MGWILLLGEGTGCERCHLLIHEELILDKAVLLFAPVDRGAVTMCFCRCRLLRLLGLYSD